MMKKFWIIMALLCNLVAVSTVQADEVVRDTAVGAVVGVAAGATMGGRDGAVLGGLLGALAGASIAASDDSHRGYDRSHVVYVPAPVYYQPVATPVYYYVPNNYVAPTRYYAPNNFDNHYREHEEHYREHDERHR
jgi:hypothetical protein